MNVASTRGHIPLTRSLLTKSNVNLKPGDIFRVKVFPDALPETISEKIHEVSGIPFYQLTKAYLIYVPEEALHATPEQRQEILNACGLAFVKQAQCIFASETEADHGVVLDVRYPDSI